MPTAQYPDLNQMFGPNSMYPAKLGMERYNMARGNEQINQQQALQDFYQKEQTNPLDVQQKNIANQTSLAQLPGFEADSSIKKDKASLSKATLSEQEKAQLSQLSTQMSDDEVKSLFDNAQVLATSQDNPHAQAIGQSILLHKADVLAERAKQNDMADRQKELEAVRGKNAVDLANVNNAAGRYKKGGILSIKEQLTSGKLSYEKAAVLTNALADQAQAEGDQEKAELYRNMANNYAQKHVESKQAGAMVPRAGTPDLGNLGIQPNPAVPMAPMAAASQPKQTIQTPQKGMPTAGEIRGGYKFKGGNPADKNNWEKQ